MIQFPRYASISISIAIDSSLYGIDAVSPQANVPGSVGDGVVGDLVGSSVGTTVGSFDGICVGSVVGI